MKKTLYTLNIGNYAPEMMKLTMPLMQRYASKIGADFQVITKRQFPDFPIPYEKFQISKLCKENNDEWSYFFDADTLIHPDFWDPTEVISKDITVSNGTDFVPIRFKTDNYFRRDGRMIGKGNWLGIASDWCNQDYFSPLHDLTPKEATQRITPTISELMTVIEPQHLIDDFTVSRNISRFGLKHILIPDISENAKVRQGNLWHQYLMPIDQKTFYMKKQLLIWAAEGLADDERQGDIINMINQLAWRKDQKIDWEDFISVLPCGDRLAKCINSWGIEIKKKSFDEISLVLKKNVLLSELSRFPDIPAKQNAMNAVSSLNANVKVGDFLAALKDIGLGLVERLKINMDIDIVLPEKR